MRTNFSSLVSGHENVNESDSGGLRDKLADDPGEAQVLQAWLIDWRAIVGNSVRIVDKQPAMTDSSCIHDY